MIPLPPRPLQLQMAKEHVAQHGGRLAYVLIDDAAQKTLAEPHPLRQRQMVTFAWERETDAETYRRTLKLGANWRTWPTTTITLDLGAAEESRLRQPSAWNWKRDSKPPRQRLDHINPWTGEVERSWWGNPLPDFSASRPAPLPEQTWGMGQLAALIGLALQYEIT